MDGTRGLTLAELWRRQVAEDGRVLEELAALPAALRGASLRVSHVYPAAPGKDFILAWPDSPLLGLSNKMDSDTATRRGAAPLRAAVEDATDAFLERLAGGETVVLGVDERPWTLGQGAYDPQPREIAAEWFQRPSVTLDLAANRILDRTLVPGFGYRSTLFFSAVRVLEGEELADHRRCEPGRDEKAHAKVHAAWERRMPGVLALYYRGRRGAMREVAAIIAAETGVERSYVEKLLRTIARSERAKAAA